MFPHPDDPCWICGKPIAPGKFHLDAFGFACHVECIAPKRAPTPNPQDAAE